MINTSFTASVGVGVGETVSGVLNNCQRCWWRAVVSIIIFSSSLLTHPIQAAELPPRPFEDRGKVHRDASEQLVAVPNSRANAPSTKQETAETSPTAAIQPRTTPPANPASGGRQVLPNPRGAKRTELPSLDALPKTIRVGLGGSVMTISGAAALARDGDTIEIDAGDYRADVAIWKQDNLTIRGVGGRPRLIADGASAENKAIWVIRGGHVVVENLEFSGAKVPDKNGAGIRFEKGDLTVRNCRFINNENGILTASGDLRLVIANSEFGNNGAGDGYSHNIYVGAIKQLYVTGSYFHHANIGHLLKSRAAESHILYNRLTDEIGGRASYELEFPNGGLAYVIGNIIEQGSQTENSTIISFGSEGYKWPRNELYLASNTIVDDRPQGGIFLRVAAGAQIVKGFNNLLIGTGRLDGNGNTSLLSRTKSALKSMAKGAFGIADSQLLEIPGEFANNFNVDLDVFSQPTRFDYRIRKGANLPGTYIRPAQIGSISLSPQLEYLHPTQTRQLSAAPTLPGALQTQAQP